MLPVFLFELRFRFRQISTYLYFALLFLLAFGFVASDVVKIAGGDARVMINAPLVISRIVTILVALGAVMASAIVGTAVQRDFEAGVHELFFTTHVPKAGYFGGRFLGAFAVTLAVFSGILWGLFFGTLMPWVDSAKLQPFRAGSYVQPFLVYLLPNLLLISALFFTLGALTRSLLAIYTQGIVLLVGYLVAASFLGDLDNRALASLLDPFGLVPTSVLTRYWTAAEKNAQVVPLAGYLLWNRLLWAGVALATLATGYRLFAFSAGPRARRKARADAPAREALPAPAGAIRPPAVDLRFDRAASWGHLGRLVGFHGRDIVRGVPFLVIVLAGMLLLVTAALQADKLFGTTIYPVTRVMAETIGGSFTLFLLILITFYAGELTWKERVLRLDQIHDALPIGTAVTLLGKIAAVVAMLAGLLVALIGTGVLIQAGKGYFRFEPGLYFAYLFGTVFPGLVLLTVLAFFVHAVVDQKFLGHTAMVVFYVGQVAFVSLGWEHNLYLYGSTPNLEYSDMNRFGPFAEPVFWFTLYWSAFAVLLAIAALLLWVRGTEASARRRLAGARSRWTAPLRGAAAFASVAFVALGGFIFYNTNVLHTYRTEKDLKRLQVRYEKKYRRYADLPVPHITDVAVRVELFPERRQYRVRGTYRLRNKTGRPVREIPVTLDEDLTVRSLRFDRPAEPVLSDGTIGFHSYRLARPLPPGGSTTMTFDLAYDKRGFPNEDVNTDVVRNGSFLSGAVPAIGYQEQAELADEDERKKQGLAPRPRMAPASDLKARRNAYIAQDADWIHFEATVGTSPDQIAIAPGYLQREWTEGGRRYFHYRMDAPIRNFYTFLSARYRVRRARWNDVAIEIYHHPSHAYNLDRMVRAVQRSLDYYTAHFGPYQYRQVRIVEFPRYQMFAQSFPNTIPYSEGVGFIARVRDSDIDYPFYVTAHEVAHQWWAHQVVGGNVEGSEMLSESLAEYSALMVMEKEYGPDRMRKFLRHNLDQYLAGRGAERQDEQPLLRVQHQPYIHYNKGALVFYALRDYIGEARLNRALARFIRDKGFQEPPYTTARELMPYLRAVTPPPLQYLLPDLFERITLYDNKVRKATYREIAPGRYRVTLTLAAQKLRAGGSGEETPVPLKDSIDVGVFGKARGGRDLGEPLVLEKRTLTKPATTLEFYVREEPEKAGIDPYNKLIDRAPGDNVRKLSVAGKGG